MAAFDDLYAEIILDHYRSPRHHGTTCPDPHVHVHHHNPLCGDELDLRVHVAGDRVAALVFEGDGCSISLASASAMAEAVHGRTVADTHDLTDAFRRMVRGEDSGRDDDLGDGVAFAGVARYPVRVKCALLGWMALRDALTRTAGGEAGHDGYGDPDEQGADTVTASAPHRTPGRTP